ncbi:Leucine-rich repeat,Leucine-rich repeat domain, L domain-like,Leucine-rich repeat, typical subtype [Cinara cedri]|uniref:Leucine-rich repeat,Leucine-rich repeat domain, L domain-like,Leucine-rich repeat, typical subtype n=1 Tax=Cinara cedri TaxID=506608 RepID=A0A5E4NJ05_9HEMI|nr:Leucine-rich repeat,Leucine-rich repeat domain, L domain-like,Leucine-rich repeat, typical subtype [Cinara cedri]
MLILCMVDIQNLDATPWQRNSRFFRSCVLSKQSNDNYYISVKNSKYPNSITYDLAELENVHHKFIKQGKLGLRFEQPNHLVLIKSDDKPLLELFLMQIQNIVIKRPVVIATRHMPRTIPPKKKCVNRFNPMSREFVAINRFDNRVLNMKQLNYIVLENCDVPSLPIDVGNLPIAYLSLSNSKLATTQYEQDIFWNWMSMNTISNTLKTLRLDHVDLRVLPFETLFLKNLETLSVSNNNLTFLPQCIGELQKLKVLDVAENMLNYLPISLYNRTFQTLNISSNKFMQHDSLLYDHIHSFVHSINRCICSEIQTPENPAVKMLSHLSFCSLLKNNVKFKRQDLPRSLWKYFDLAGRCINCDQFMLPYNIIINHTVAYPTASNLIRNQDSGSIPWQTMACRFKCLTYSSSM